MAQAPRPAPMKAETGDDSILQTFPRRMATDPTLAKLSLARTIAAHALRRREGDEEYDPGQAGRQIDHGVLDVPSNPTF